MLIIRWLIYYEHDCHVMCDWPSLHQRPCAVVTVTCMCHWYAHRQSVRCIARIPLATYLLVLDIKSSALSSQCLADWLCYNQQWCWLDHHVQICWWVVPVNAPKPLSKGVDMQMVVVSGHARDKLTRQYRSGYRSFLNMALIDWLSKNQSTIKYTVFGAGFVSMKQGTEARGWNDKIST